MSQPEEEKIPPERTTRVSGRVDEVARAVRDVAREVAAEAEEYLSASTTKYPLAALLIGGAIGFGIGFLSRRR